MYFHTLTRRQFCDLTLILNGGFYPLTGFLSQADYECVLSSCRLKNNIIWPIPIILDVNESIADNLLVNQSIFLRDQENNLIATMIITDIWKPNQLQEAETIYGTQSNLHPGVCYLLNHTESIYIGGPVTLIQFPLHIPFYALQHSPAFLKDLFLKNKIERVVGFQTRNPMHRAHVELTKRVAAMIDAHILLHPTVGETKPGDVDCVTRVKCYQQIMKYYKPHAATLSVIPLSMRMAGPREALWHALIRKNYGCTHFIIGRDHAEPSDGNDKNFYSPYAAQDFTNQFSDEINIKISCCEVMHYVKSKNCYLFSSEIEKNTDDIEMISGRALKNLLHARAEIPLWFSYPEVITILQKIYLPKNKQGLTLFFTGLPGSGKSTLAHAMMDQLQAVTDRTLSLLDGDIFRQISDNRLGFSKRDRDENVKRIGLMATEITKHQGIVICALIAPYAATRQWVRNHVTAYGGFIEIYVSTPIDVCEARDPKGHYAKARLNELKNFTGIDDPYDVPTHPELIIDTSSQSLQNCVQTLMHAIAQMGYFDFVRDEVNSCISIAVTD